MPQSLRSVVAASLDAKDDPNRVPQPSHRHAAPSAPWPWMDIDDEVDPNQLNTDAPPVPDICDHKNCDHCWKGYPQSRFPNWTPRQVRKSKIAKAVSDYRKDVTCVLYRMDVDSAGIFRDAGRIEAKYGEEGETWQTLLTAERPKDLRVRALFIENMSGPILQMLGTMYNIEPFFWSSSLNWIPSRFQAGIDPGVGDHITLTLTFLRSMSNHDAQNLGAALGTRFQNKSSDTLKQPPTLLGSQNIDTQAPLALHSNNRLLVLDLLAVHLIRNNVTGSTMISYHPNLNIPTTQASFLHERIRFAGQSVYWQSMFQQTPDPTFVLLTFIWHAMYAWDEALENLYQHICSLESRVIETSEMPLTQELHVIRAHHLHYTSLLDDYSKHVIFIRDTPNPAASSMTPEERDYSKTVMARECANLVTEIKRLTATLAMQERRLKNVMGLVFSFVNIKDSRTMREMTEAAVRDSAGKHFCMKQVAYLTMVFLPASFVAGVFGMNIQEINPGTLGTAKHYVELALPLTLITIWVIIAFQSTYIFDKETTFLKRLGWPVYLLHMKIQQHWKPKGDGLPYSSEISKEMDEKSFYELKVE